MTDDRYDEASTGNVVASDGEPPPALAPDPLLCVAFLGSPRSLRDQAPVGA
jgi:hypothetical protein